MYFLYIWDRFVLSLKQNGDPEPPFDLIWSYHGIIISNCCYKELWDLQIKDPSNCKVLLGFCSGQLY